MEYNRQTGERKDSKKVDGEQNPMQHEDGNQQEPEVIQLPFKDIEGRTMKYQKSLKDKKKSKAVKMKDLDRQLFNKDELVDLQYIDNRPPQQTQQIKNVRSQSVQKENQKLRRENEKLHSMCLELTTMVKKLSVSKKIAADVSRKSTDAIFPAKFKPKQIKSEISRSTRNGRRTESKVEETTRKTAASSFKIEKDQNTNISKFQQVCLANDELENYERENRHRYIPKDLSQSNLKMASKIDKDIK